MVHKIITALTILAMLNHLASWNFKCCSTLYLVPNCIGLSMNRVKGVMLNPLSVEYQLLTNT